MTQKVLDGVTRALRGVFPEAGIFTEDVPQGLRPGDFAVRAVGLRMDPAPGGMNRWELRLQISCFLAEGPVALDRLEALFGAAEWIEVAGGLRLKGVRERMEVKEGVARVLLRFTFYAVPGAAERMEAMEYAAGL